MIKERSKSPPTIQNFKLQKFNKLKIINSSEQFKIFRTTQNLPNQSTFQKIRSSQTSNYSKQFNIIQNIKIFQQLQNLPATSICQKCKEVNINNIFQTIQNLPNKLKIFQACRNFQNFKLSKKPKDSTLQKLIFKDSRPRLQSLDCAD